MENIKIRIEKLRLLKRHYDLQYWKHDSSKELDSIYDQVKDELDNLLKQYPQFKVPEDDILESTHMNQNGLIKVNHKYKLMSLAKALNFEEFSEWLNSLTTMLKLASEEIIVLHLECKIDGLAVSLEYEDGVLLRGSTRGDGWIGDDITPIVFQIKDIPKKLPNKFTGEIGGEIYMKKSSLIQLNEELKFQGKEMMKNVRNAASGIVKRKDASMGHGKYLNFLCYRLKSDFDKKATYYHDMDYVELLGFPTVYFNLNGAFIRIKDKDYLSNMKKEFEKFEKMRKDIDLDIDGVVAKINSKKLQKQLGEKTNTPNWAIAYKFPPQEKITKLLNVEWELGDKGNITPMAVINPVEIGGTTVKRPTLHNLDEIKRLGIKIGDTCVVSRRGDVIPKLEKVIPELRTEIEKDIKIPDKCPICGESTIIKGAYLRCENENCEGRLLGKIMNFIHSMEIDNMGDKVVLKLIKNGNIKNIIDIYNLQISDISKLERMGEKSATKIINNVNKSKKQPLWRVIMGLSIPNIGESNAKSLENHFKALENLINININQLININDIGEIISSNIVKWFNNSNNIKIINKLIELNIGNTMEKIELSSNKLNGYKIAFTGKLQNYSRKECEKVIKENGGIVISIKKEIDILLIGDGAKPAKKDKAEKLGAKIITEEEFLNMLK